MGDLSFCLVSTFYPPANFGGDGINVQRLARGLAARGHRVRVLHNPMAHRATGSGGAQEAPAEDTGIEVLALGGAISTLSTYLTGTPVGYRRKLQELTDGFDVVHFHNPSLLGGPGALGIPSALRVYTTHEHWLVCPMHVLFRNQREVCEERTCFRCAISYRRPPQLWRATGLMARAVDQLDLLLCPSRFTAEIHRRAFPSAPIAVLPLTAPIPPALPSRSTTAPRRRPYFLYAGRLEPIKGVDRLVAAFHEVRGADLVVAGNGSLRERLVQLAAGSGTVELVGRRSQEEIFALCRDALAVVVPSSGYETFGGVALEAMAMGTAALVRDLGPLPELVEDGGGLTFGDDADLVRTLQHLVDDPELAAKLGEEAADIAGSRFGETGHFREYFRQLELAATGAGRNDLAIRLAAAGAGE